MGDVHSEIDGRICTITIENEGKRNAMDFSMVDSMIETFEDLEARGDVRAVVIRGAGERAFSAGFDLTVDRTDQTERQKRLWADMTDTIESYTYPVIAMANGDTYGGAVEIVAAADLCVGVEGARFGITPAKIGLVYGGRAINRIVNLVGPRKTKEMLFTANPIDATHAAEIGLLNYVVPRAELEDRTYGMAEDIATNAPFSLRGIKEITDAIAEKDRLSEAETKWIKQLREQAFESDDHAEGVAAFNENRTPEFRDR